MRRRRWLTPTSALLMALAFGFGGLYVGIHAEKGQAASHGSTRVAVPAVGRSSGGVTVGTVTRVDGDTIYVKEGSGAAVAVKLVSGTTISKAQSVSPRSIRPGDSVTIQGGAGSGGVVKSTSVSDSGDDSTTTTASTAQP
jgi:hypothetical protein